MVNNHPRSAGLSVLIFAYGVLFSLFTVYFAPSVALLLALYVAKELALL